MRLAGVVAVVAMLGGAARAEAPYFEIIPDSQFPTAAVTETFTIHLHGAFDPGRLAAAYLPDPLVSFVLAVDGAPIGQFPLYGRVPDDLGVYHEVFPTGWVSRPVTLTAGWHQVTATYHNATQGLDASGALSLFVMAALVPVDLGGFGLQLPSRKGTPPDLQPVGEVTLTNTLDGTTTSIDIADLLMRDPSDGSFRLRLDGLPDDTLITYPGDANFPALSYTLDAAEVPAPGLAWLPALGLLGLVRQGRKKGVLF